MYTRWVHMCVCIKQTVCTHLNWFLFNLGNTQKETDKHVISCSNKKKKKKKK